jgi:flagellar protein FliS
MSRSQNTQYLESKVLTAPAHRLHLMLIEGAIRFGREAEVAMRRGEYEGVAAPLVRVIEIVGELLAGVRETKTELNQKIADFYLFLFRTISEAKVNDDVEKLSEALGLLEFERQTWQLVCDKLGTEPVGATRPTQSPVAYARPQTPFIPPLGGTMPTTSLGISLEA